MTQERWKTRFTAPRPGFPDWAEAAPHRSLYTCNTSGACEIHVWDRAADLHRQVTRRPAGTSLAALTADGERIWWFDDRDGDEFGQWMAQPFDAEPGTSAVPAAPGVPPGYPAGLALGRTLTLVATADDEGTGIWILRPGQLPVRTAQYEDDVELVALSADERTAVLVRPRADGSPGTELEVVATESGASLTVVTDEAGHSLDAFSFSPVPGDQRLLVQHASDDSSWLGVLDLDTGAETRVELPDGDIGAQWYPDGKALLITLQHQARSTLHRYDLATGEPTQLPTPAGTIDAAAVRPDGRVEYHWSSSAHPPVVRTLDGADDRVLFRPPGETPPPGPALEDAWVDTPAGALHVLVARPSAAPRATVFLLHGGPHAADLDRYSAYRSVWTDACFTVVHVNYRGSTGYGTSWRDANHGLPGFPELEDLTAAYDWAVGRGIADPGRCLVAGSSWGGFLTLLALGVQPGRWMAGVSESPIADHAAAFTDRPDFLQAFDRTLFGGSPEEQPELYVKCSPITYAERIEAPLLILTGENDPRCPARQLDLYLGRLAEEGVRHQVYRYDTGHGTLVGAELIRQAAAQITFVTELLDRLDEARQGS